MGKPRLFPESFCYLPHIPELAKGRSEIRIPPRLFSRFVLPCQVYPASWGGVGVGVFLGAGQAQKLLPPSPTRIRMAAWAGTRLEETSRHTLSPCSSHSPLLHWSLWVTPLASVHLKPGWRWGQSWPLGGGRLPKSRGREGGTCLRVSDL